MCKGNETKTKSSKIPPERHPLVPLGVKYPRTLVLQSYPNIQNLGSLSPKERKLELKVPKRSVGSAPKALWASEGVKYPALWNLKVTPTYKI